MTEHLISGKGPQEPFNFWTSVRSILLMSPMPIGVYAASAVEGFWVSSACVVAGLLVSLLALWKAGAIVRQSPLSITSVSTEPFVPRVHSELSTASK